MAGRRIAIFANSDLRYDRRLQRIADSLRSGGYQVQLFGRRFSGDFKGNQSTDRHIKLWINKGKLAYLELNLRFFLQMLTARTDALCSVDLDTLPAAWLAAKIKGCYLVQDSHEYMAEVPEVSHRPLTKQLWHRIARFFLPGCHLRYTTSQSLVDEFLVEYQTSFALIRNIPPLLPVHSDMAYGADVPFSDYLVYLGAVNQGRGLEEILEVLANRDEKLVVIGEGDQSKEIRKLILQYGLSDRVFMTGKLLPSELPAYLRPAKAGLNLLRDEGLSYRYSLANKFFDYVHAGIPQVCIDFPEYRKLMEEFRVGLICDLRPEAIHQALDEIKKTENQLYMRREAEKARKHWNWQLEETNLLALYRNLFAQDKPK